MGQHEVDQFDPAPDPDLVCVICHCIFEDPRETPCHHVFCQGCINRWLERRLTCPTCRTGIITDVLEPAPEKIKTMLNLLMIRCVNMSNGCRTISLGIYPDHKNNCAYEMLSCTFPNCEIKVLRRDLAEHEQDCEWRQIRCWKDCGLLFAIKDKETHNCVLALKESLSERNRLFEELQRRATELEELTTDLRNQLTDVTRQLNQAVAFRDDMSESWVDDYDYDDWESIASQETTVMRSASDVTVAVAQGDDEANLQPVPPENVLEDDVITFNEWLHQIGANEIPEVPALTADTIMPVYNASLMPASVSNSTSGVVSADSGNSPLDSIASWQGDFDTPSQNSPLSGEFLDSFPFDLMQGRRTTTADEHESHNASPAYQSDSGPPEQDAYNWRPIWESCSENDRPPSSHHQEANTDRNRSTTRDRSPSYRSSSRGRSRSCSLRERDRSPTFSSPRRNRSRSYSPPRSYSSRRSYSGQRSNSERSLPRSPTSSRDARSSDVSWRTNRERSHLRERTSRNRSRSQPRHRSRSRGWSSSGFTRSRSTSRPRHTSSLNWSRSGSRSSRQSRRQRSRSHSRYPRYRSRSPVSWQSWRSSYCSSRSRSRSRRSQSRSRRSRSRSRSRSRRSQSRSRRSCSRSGYSSRSWYQRQRSYSRSRYTSSARSSRREYNGWDDWYSDRMSSNSVSATNSTMTRPLDQWDTSDGSDTDYIPTSNYFNDVNSSNGMNTSRSSDDTSKTHDCSSDWEDKMNRPGSSPNHATETDTSASAIVVSDSDDNHDKCSPKQESSQGHQFSSPKTNLKSSISSSGCRSRSRSPGSRSNSGWHSDIQATDRGNCRNNSRESSPAKSVSPNSQTSRSPSLARSRSSINSHHGESCPSHSPSRGPSRSPSHSPSRSPSHSPGSSVYSRPVASPHSPQCTSACLHPGQAGEGLNESCNELGSDTGGSRREQTSSNSGSGSPGQRDVQKEEAKDQSVHADGEENPLKDSDSSGDESVTERGRPWLASAAASASARSNSDEESVRSRNFDPNRLYNFVHGYVEYNLSNFVNLLQETLISQFAAAGVPPHPPAPAAQTNQEAAGAGQQGSRPVRNRANGDAGQETNNAPMEGGGPIADVEVPGAALLDALVNSDSDSEGEDYVPENESSDDDTISEHLSDDVEEESLSMEELSDAGSDGSDHSEQNLSYLMSNSCVSDDSDSDWSPN